MFLEVGALRIVRLVSGCCGFVSLGVISVRINCVELVCLYVCLYACVGGPCVAWSELSLCVYYCACVYMCIAPCVV